MDLEILIYGFPAVLITIGLTQVVKNFVEKRWIPIVAILFGISLVSLSVWNYWTPEALVKGLVVGLIASGLWSGTKRTLLNK